MADARRQALPEFFRNQRALPDPAQIRGYLLCGPDDTGYGQALTPDLPQRERDGGAKRRLFSPVIAAADHITVDFPDPTRLGLDFAIRGIHPFVIDPGALCGGSLDQLHAIELAVGILEQAGVL